MLTEINSYIVAGIVSAAFLLIYGIKIKYNFPEYKKGDLLAGYLFTRILPLLLLREPPAGLGINLVLDFVMLTFLVRVMRSIRAEDIQVMSRNAVMVYLYNPVIMLSILSGKQSGVLLCFVILIVLLLLEQCVERKIEGFHAVSFYPEYVLCSLGGVGLLIARNVLFLAPVLLAMILSVRRVLTGGIHKKWKEKPDTLAEEQAPPEDTPLRGITKKDVLAIVLITGLFFFIALYRLGSLNVPETTLTLKTDGKYGKEMVLDMGEYEYISRVSVYLGYQGKRKLSFSYYDVSEKKWVPFKENHMVESAFTWNDVKVEGHVWYLGIVAMDEEASLQEIVIVGKNGETHLPVNYMDYEEAFDEQELFVPIKTYYDGTMFDEIYHGRTAYEFLHKLPIYETTHPPLGKTIISIGIALFGMNPFGYRIMCVICGALMIPFIYLFALKLSKRTQIAVMAAVLLATEFMHFTLSRIATIDIIVALFVLMMYYFMFSYIDDCRQGIAGIKRMLWLLPCGISMGCAMAVKWTGIYAAAGIAIWFFVHLISQMVGRKLTGQLYMELKKLAVVCVCCFIAIPAVIYVLSYIPFTAVYWDKSLLQHVFDSGELMLNYHAVTVFKHPYASEWYDWLVNRVPLLDAYAVLEDGNISAIATFGSPLVIWGGIVAGIYNLYLWRCRDSKKSGYLVLGYLAMLVPWLFVHRTVFIYQYYICTLFLILMIANAVMRIKGKQKLICYGIMLVSTCLFLLFYPVVSGYPVNPDWVNQALEWFDTWRFAL